MNSELFDPDLKINMSLDEIIHLTRTGLLAQLRGRFPRNVKKKKTQKKKGNSPNSNHSVPLMSSLGGGFIFVSKKSPLLSVENRRRIATAVSNRMINSQLIEKTKEIIPASYKLVQTSNGVERVLVPVEEYVVDTVKKKPLPRLRHLKPTTIKNSSVISHQPQQPPPSIVSPTYNTIRSPNTNNEPVKMEIDESDDEVVILDYINRKEADIIDVESQINRLNLRDKPHLVVPEKPIKTLHDRFTLLSAGINLQ